MKNFLNKVLYAKVWELLVLLIVVAAIATLYRIYFSRAVALTQVCERLQDLQNDENADAFNSLTGEVGDASLGHKELCSRVFGIDRSLGLDALP